MRAIAIQLSAEGDAAGGPRLPADVQVGLYRIAQEALNNVVKHAKATQAVVTLRQGETVRLTVADNGAGFDPGAVTADHLGSEDHARARRGDRREAQHLQRTRRRDAGVGGVGSET